MSTWLICGKGPSAKGFPKPTNGTTTVGINDVHTMLGWEPDYLSVFDPHESYKGERRAAMDDIVQRVPVITSKKATHWPHAARRIFVKPKHVQDPRVGPLVCEMRQDDRLFISIVHTSATSACLFAVFHGATRVELIGIDFSEDYSLGQPDQLKRLNATFATMVRQYPDVEFVNLSPVSRLETVKRAA